MRPTAGPGCAGVAPVPAYPDRYRKLAAPLGSLGAIKVEASPWVEDNLWVLDVAQRDTIIVGVIGNLEPDKPEFKEYFDRYRKHPLFRGIRYGNLWGRDIGKQAENPAFIDGLKLLADADLVLDTANPRMPLLDAMVKISDKVPTLRIVLDHLPNFEPAADERPAYDAVLKEFAKRPQIYVKLSAILRRVNGEVSTDLSAVPGEARHARGDVRRGSDSVRQRLAEQRWRRADRSDLPGREGVLRLEAESGRGEVFLEELGRGLQVDQARAFTAVPLTPRTIQRRDTGTQSASQRDLHKRIRGQGDGLPGRRKHFLQSCPSARSTIQHRDTETQSASQVRQRPEDAVSWEARIDFALIAHHETKTAAPRPTKSMPRPAQPLCLRVAVLRHHDSHEIYAAPGAGSQAGNQ